jgi:hypothetical protein
MGYTIECQNCSNRFNPNNRDLCPTCKTRPERVDISVGNSAGVKPNRNNRSIGILGWYLILFVVGGLIGGLITMNEFSDSPNPSSGYDAEWEADNSIEGPAGTFDDQSKF